MPSSNFLPIFRLIARTGLEDRLSLTRNLNAFHMPAVLQSRKGSNTEEWNKFGSVSKISYSRLVSWGLLMNILD